LTTLSALAECGADGAGAANIGNFGLGLCLPVAPVPPIHDNEKFGTFSF
jgi:hypothetical protein